MKKHFIIFILALLLTAICTAAVSAQSLSADEIKETFTKAVLRENFVNKTNMQYYRFAKNIWYFDSLGLSYFPSETVTDIYWENPDNFKMTVDSTNLKYMSEEDWALLGREMTGRVAKQFIYLPEPTKYDVFHGLDFPRVKYLENFYLYTDLFVLDEYPEGSGSCYVHFSNSMLSGNRDSYGILIDPRSGIYKASNNYDSTNAVTNRSRHYGYYVIGAEQHGLELIKELDPSLYEGKTGCIGNDIFTIENLDTKFNEDFEALKASAEKEGLTQNISVYRIEIVRLAETTAVYINGVFVAEFKDGIKTDGITYVSARTGNQQVISIHGKYVDLKTIEGTARIDDVVISKLDDNTWSVNDPSTITEMVSWTIGPRLYAGGETVTMAAGDMILYEIN